MPESYQKAINSQLGLVSSLRSAKSLNPFADGTHLVFGRSGRLDELFPELMFESASSEGLFVTGSGCAVDPELAARKAVFETFERYATAIYSNRDVVIASVEELGAEAIDLTLLPTLHVRLPGESKWEGRPIDRRAPIRWRKGFHLLQRRVVYIPLVMVQIYAKPLVGENFYPQTTTGTAANTSLNDATVSALCEIVERDAVETIWRTQAPLQRIDIDSSLPTELAGLHELDLKGRVFVNQEYFDATLEAGIPTIYAVRRVSPPLGNDVIVSCACHPSATQALYKARLEASSQQLMRLSESSGRSYSRYRHEEGYLVNDVRELRPDLSFLEAQIDGQIKFSELIAKTENLGPGSAATVLAAIAARNKEVAIIDIATDELRDLGVHVVKAIIPTLMTAAPSSDQMFIHHPRLKEVANRFGLPSWSVKSLNTTQQPFC